MRPEIARFLARHSQTHKESVWEDVRPYVGMSPEEAWLHVEAAARSAALLLACNPDRARLAQYCDPPHPSYWGIMKRLKARKRASPDD